MSGNCWVRAVTPTCLPQNILLLSLHFLLVPCAGKGCTAWAWACKLAPLHGPWKPVVLQPMTLLLLLLMCVSVLCVGLIIVVLHAFTCSSPASSCLYAPSVSVFMSSLMSIMSWSGGGGGGGVGRWSGSGVGWVEWSGGGGGNFPLQATLAPVTYLLAAPCGGGGRRGRRTPCLLHAAYMYVNVVF